MTQQSLTSLVHALGIAAFARQSDGSFEPLGEVPAWFGRITSDATFPFLGHILEDADLFWRQNTGGTAEFGPCVEVNEAGQEFHYKVVAVAADSAQYLVFQLDPAADQVRQILQKVRTEALAAERDAATYEAASASLHHAHLDIKDLVDRLWRSDPTPAQRELLNRLTTACVSVMGGVADLIRSTTVRRV